jgi:hypothetical protein
LAADKTDKRVQHWLNELKAAQKREKDYRKDGQRIIDIYDGTKAKQTPFNILFANTETLFPALYSTLPRPVVERRFKDDDAIGKAGAMAGKRVLEFLLDTNIEGYETFDLGMKNAVLDALLPGRGVTAVKYDADVQDIPEGEEVIPYKKSELACVDSRAWNRVFFGYAKKWSKVPWVAYEEHIDREEATRLFGEKIASQLVYTEADDREEKGKRGNEDDQGERRTCCIYQIWDKESRKVRYISEQYKDGYLKEEDDPLGLTGFFNCPRPMQFIEKSSDLSPVALYIIYEHQAQELNRIQQRINKIVEAIKARGVYDGELGEDLARIMEADDNMLIPADKASSLAAEKGLQNAIWFMPLEQLVVTLQQLYAARESCKQVIYEITGIADIMRGQSQASETLGAQQIKQSWGNLRLKRLQKEVQRYARDLLRLMLEIAATKFSEETWARMTSLPYLTEAKVQELQQVSAGLKQQAQLAQATQNQQQFQQVQQQLQQVDQQLQTPKWSDVLAMLKDDVQRAYRIDIETNSTVEPEAVEDQEHITQLMNSIGQYLNGIGPLVANGVMPFDAARAMLLAIVRRYRFGSEIEDQITAMQPPQEKDDGSKQKMEMEKQKHDAEMQKTNVEVEAKKQENAQKAALAERQHALDMERMQREAEYQAAEHRMRMGELSAKAQVDQIVTASKLRVAQATAAAKEKQAMQPQGSA